MERERKREDMKTLERGDNELCLHDAHNYDMLE